MTPSDAATSVVTATLGFGPDDYVSSEDIYAGYLMGTYRLCKFTGVAGGRYELTKQYLFRLAADNTPLTFDDDYRHFTPGVHLRYDITPDIIARASWNNTRRSSGVELVHKSR